MQVKLSKMKEFQLIKKWRKHRQDFENKILKHSYTGFDEIGELARKFTKKVDCFK